MIKSGNFVLTIDRGDQGEIEEIVRKFSLPVYVSRVIFDEQGDSCTGVSVPELRVPEGHFNGRKRIKGLLEYWGNYGSYEPFLDQIS